MTRTHLNLNLYYNVNSGVKGLPFPDAPELGECPHAQEAMKRLGITYKFAHPIPVGDCWNFYDCENVPDDLPHWLRRIDVPDEEVDKFLNRSASQ